MPSFALENLSHSAVKSSCPKAYSVYIFLLVETTTYNESMTLIKAGMRKEDLENCYLRGLKKNQDAPSSLRNSKHLDTNG